MKIVLDIDGWKKEETFLGSVLCGYVEIGFLPPLSILTVEQLEIPITEKRDGLVVRFEFRGKYQGTLPIFEYAA